MFLAQCFFSVGGKLPNSRKYIPYLSAVHLEVCNVVQMSSQLAEVYVSFVIFEHLEEIRPYGPSRSQVEHWVM